MKKSVIFFLLLVVSMPVWGGSMDASAQANQQILDNLGGAAQQPFGASPDGRAEVEPGAAVANIATVVFGFVGTIAFAFTLYGGFLWLTAGGNEDQVNKAKEYLKNSVIGIIVIVLAYGGTIYIIDLAFQAVQGDL